MRPSRAIAGDVVIRISAESATDRRYVLSQAPGPDLFGVHSMALATRTGLEYAQRYMVDVWTDGGAEGFVLLARYRPSATSLTVAQQLTPGSFVGPKDLWARAPVRLVP